MKKIKMDREEFIKKFLESNPKIDKKDLNIRLDGRVEWICSHGVGHTIWYPKGSSAIHGCDGCCKKLNLEFMKK